MFKKKPHVTHRNLLKGSDIGKLRKQVCESFGVDEQYLQECLGNKSRLQKCKCQEKFVLYEQDGVPLLFDPTGREDMIIPSLFLLWKVPELLIDKRVYIFPNTSEYLLKGAKLMWPGILNGKQRGPTLPLFEVGEILPIFVLGNPLPIGLGRALTSSRHLELQGAVGRAVDVIQIFGDGLWELANQNVPDGFGFERIDAVAGDEGWVRLDGVSAGVEELAISNGEEESSSVRAKEENDNVQASKSGDECSDEDADTPKISPEVMDEAMLHTAVVCLHFLPKDEFPIQTSTFFAKYMQKSSLYPFALDMKQSSFKKLSKFLDHLKKRGLVELKNVKPSGSCIFRMIDCSEVKDILSGFQHVTEKIMVKAWHRSEGGGAGEASTTMAPPPVAIDSITTYLAAPRKVYTQLEGMLPPGNFWSKPQLVEALWRHVQAAGIAPMGERRDLLAMGTDSILHAIERLSSSNWSEGVPKAALSIAYLGLFTNVWVLTRAQEPDWSFKSKPEVSIVVKKRQGRKRVTTIQGLEKFHIDEHAITSWLSTQQACSATLRVLETSIGAPQERREIVMQGDQAASVTRMLSEGFNIPRCYFNIVNKG